jgi:hypothetical protein
LKNKLHQKWVLHTVTLLSIFCILISCRSQSYKNQENPFVQLDTTLFEKPVGKKALNNPKINEASGLIASRVIKNHFWTHNDSGGENEIYLINQEGINTYKIQLKGIKNRDWEDLSYFYNSSDSSGYIFVAETGDNNAEHKENYLYFFKEPTIEKINNNKESLQIDSIQRITFKYPNGQRDAETLLHDPINNDIIIITKREDSVMVYSIQYPYDTKNVINLSKKTTLPFHKIISGDVSQDGMEVLLKDYDNIYYWKKSKKEQTIIDLIKTKPVRLSYPREPQGESIAWSVDGSGFYTLSEERNGVKPVLYFYKRK